VAASQSINTWRKVRLAERSASQQRFLDLCALVGQPTPAAADHEGASFTSERGVHTRTLTNAPQTGLV
jgi:hypothetical protein